MNYHEAKVGMRVMVCQTQYLKYYGPNSLKNMHVAYKDSVGILKALNPFHNVAICQWPGLGVSCLEISLLSPAE
jgi:hypothetical protein